jgi:hypothetical protein
MKTRGSTKIGKDEKVVTTAVAKRDWFLTSSDLASLPRVGGGAMWGAGRLPTCYSVKGLDRLALQVHGAAGLAKKREARQKRADNKGKKKEAKGKRSKVAAAPAPEKGKRKETAVAEKEEKRPARAAASAKRARVTKDMVDEDGQGDDDGDFNPEELDEEEEKESASAKKQKTKSGGGGQKARNLAAVGSWNVDCGDCYALELWPKGGGLGGEALVCDCDVALTCSDVSGEEMVFKAIFKTEKTKYVGAMSIRLNENGTLAIEYFNGARGPAAVEFEATARRIK